MRLHILGLLVALEVSGEPIRAIELIKSIGEILVSASKTSLRLVTKSRKDLIYGHVILDLWRIK